MQNSLPIQKHNCAQSRTGLACEEMVSQENTNVVAIVDDDGSIRSALQGLMKVAGYRELRETSVLCTDFRLHSSFVVAQAILISGTETAGV
jgi:hypothetical protein